MELLGAEVEPVDAGARTLKEAVSAAIRDWVATVGDTHYVIGSVVGPGALPGAGPRPPAGDRRRGPLAGARGRGRAARARDRLRRRRLELDRDLLRLPRRPGRADRGRGRRRGARQRAATAPRSPPARTGVLHGALSSVLADEQGQILEAHSVSAGLDYPGVGPEHAHLRDSGRATYVAITDDDALRAFRELARLEGIIPALEPTHAIAWLLAEPAARTATTCSASRAAATRTWTRSRRSSPSSMADAASRHRRGRGSPTPSPPPARRAGRR